MIEDSALSKYYFSPKMLNNNREMGISAFMRVRNGEDFLELVIESHINYFDEIIICYNQCVDNTEKILYKLKDKYPKKIKIYHYEPKVYPLGSKEQMAFCKESSNINSVHSMANYSNFALSKTTKKIAVKLDDDHFAVSHNLVQALKIIKKNGLKNIYTFSGVNLLFQGSELGVAYNNAFSGNGDIYFFPVSSKSYFVSGPIYETFTVKKMKYKKKYLGILYFHLKFLKKNFGLSNYELDDLSNVSSPFHKISKDIKNKLIFASIEKLSLTPLSKVHRLSPLYRGLLWLRYPILRNFYLWIERDSLHVRRAITLETCLVAVINQWSQVQKILSCRIAKW